MNIELNKELLEAVKKGNLEIVKYLVGIGADVNAEDNDGWTALMSGASGGNLNVVKYFIEKGADVNAKGGWNITALMGGAWNDNLEIVKYLIGIGADVNAKNYEGWTALMSGVCRGNLEIVKYLIEAGADVNAKTNYGWTALMYAEDCNHTEVADYLKNNENEFKKIIEKYGNYNQKLKIIEELAELIKEITKDLQECDNWDEIVEEIADIEIMLEQSKILYGINNQILDKIKKEKIARALNNE